MDLRPLVASRPARSVTRKTSFGAGGVGFAAAALGNLTWSNYLDELNRVAADNGHDGSSAAFQGMVNYVFYDAAAFNLSGPAALNQALEDETLSIANLNAYAAAYTP